MGYIEIDNFCRICGDILNSFFIFLNSENPYMFKKIDIP